MAADLDRQRTASSYIYAGVIYTNSYPICDVASSNYVGVFGIGEPGVDGDGLFYRNSFVRLRRHHRRPEQHAGRRRAVDEPERRPGPGDLDRLGPRRAALVVRPDPFDPDGGTCKHEDGSGMTLGHTGEGHGPGDPKGDVNQFDSRHGKGAHFLYCDGHVRFLQVSIDYPTYKALSTIAGGEALSDVY